MIRSKPSETPLITLASASPRRQELLDQIQLSYEVLPVDIDESPVAGETAQQLVKRLAIEKARSGYEKRPYRPALGSDTIVIMGKQILGKPRDREMAIEMLTMLSGQTHQVMTAVAICTADDQWCLLNSSEVEFDELSQQQIEAYWETGEPQDKAGAYAVQGIAAEFIKNINGSYSGIMGLPLFETTKLIKMAGIHLLPGHVSME